MNALINTTTILTMSSLEIAELTGKEHFHIMRDIRTMLEDLGQDRSKFGCMYEDAYDRKKPCYHLPKNLTITLVSGYSVVLRSRIVDRWLELEEAAKPVTPALPDFSNPAIAARAWADEFEKRKFAEAQRDKIEADLKEAKPLITLGELVESHLRTVSEVARTLPGVNSVRIKSDLVKAGYLYRRGGPKGQYRVRSQYREKVFVEAPDGFGQVAIFAAERGHRVIASLFEEGRLTMRAGR